MDAFLVIIVAAALAFLAGRAFVRWPSPVLALAGAFAGYRLLTSGAGSYLWQEPLAWGVASVLAFLFAAVLTGIMRTALKKSRSHYLSQMWFVGLVSTAASAFLMFALVFNAGSGIAPFCRAVSPAGIFIAAAASACFLTRPFERNFLYAPDEGHFDMTPESLAASLLSVAAVSLLFSFGTPASLFGCVPSVLPYSVLWFASMAGCGLARRRAVTATSTALRIVLAAVVVPVVGLIAGYFGSSLLHPHCLDPHSGTFLTVIILSSVLVAAVLATLLAEMFVSFRRSSHALKEAENCLDENRRTVNAMEVRTMQLENEYLRNHIELQRREAVNAAISISEQKEFIGKISDMVRGAEAETDIAKKNAALHAMGTELNLRMNFASEIDSFYAQVEQLHKDFAVRLNERFPDLTKQERRLTTLLRLGFSSKYIATLMNISPKSVEICRHRLRAKLGLNRQESLTGFIKNI